MAPNYSLTQRLVKGDLSIIFYMSLFKLLMHLVLNAQGGYGLFRDELYYIACSKNLDIGYVDHPPLSIYFLRIITLVLGDSLFIVRFIPALAGATTIFLTGLIALRLGGGKLAQFLSCLFSFSLINQAMFSFYSMNALEILSWTAAAYVIILLIQSENKKYWWILGIILGLGLLNKIGMLFLGAGIFVGLLATKERKWLSTPWPYVAGALAIFIFLPYVIWNYHNDFAHLEFIRNASAGKYSSLSIKSFLFGQLMNNNPFSILIWLPGLVALFFYEDFKKYRMLGYLYAVPLVILAFNGTSKAEYLAPGYGILWASGSVWWENLIKSKVVLKYALVGIVSLWAISTSVLLPMVLPVLPVETYITYAHDLNFQPPSPEGKEQAALPQFYADMFGWQEKARGVASVFNALSEEEQKKVAIFSNNYGRCAALDYYGKQYGLPKSIGSHNNYWVWGPRGYTGELMIILGGTIDDHKDNFREVVHAETGDCEYCMPYENNVSIFVCRGLKGSLDEIWDDEKNFD